MHNRYVQISKQAKTTRDSIEAHYESNGVDICLIDTAGYLKTDNQIDQESIDRTILEINNGYIVNTSQPEIKKEGRSNCHGRKIPMKI